MMLGAGLPDSGFDTINLRDDRLPAKPHASALPNRAVASVRLVGPARYPIYGSYCSGECGAGSMMVECISSRKPGPLPKNSCQAASFIALPRASARAFRLG